MPLQMRDASIWSRGIRFKVYKLEIDLTYASLKEVFSKKNVDDSSKSDGWLANQPFFKSDDSKVFSFLYVKYVSATKASREENKKIRVPEYTAFIFDLSKKLLIVSTSSNQRLGYIERDAFPSIRALTNITGYTYSGNFLFWLAYKFDNEAGKISQNVRIEDFTAISSESESTNSTDSIRASSDVTELIESKLILGLNKHATAVQMKMSSSDILYKFEMRSDGRFVVKEKTDDEDMESMIAIAEEIHYLIQQCYFEYIEISKSASWSILTEKYSIDLLREVLRRLSTYIKLIEEAKTIEATEKDDTL